MNKEGVYDKKIEDDVAGIHVILELLDLFNDTFEKWHKTRKRRKDFLPVEERRHRLLPRFDKMPDDWYEGLLVITDYVSGMADRFALAKFEKLSSVNVNVGRA